MVRGRPERVESNQYLNLIFDERLGLHVDREAETRDSRRLALRLKAAKLRQAATVEDLDFRAPRGLDRSVVLSLAQAGWVAAHHNLLITGPTGAGKSFVACALTHAAIRRGHTALYVRTPRLLAELALSRGDGRYVRRLGQLARIGLLVLDDFLLTPPNVIEAKDLLEVIDDCRQRCFRLRQRPVDELQLGFASRLPKTAIVYQCPACEARMLGQQRCEECGVFGRRLGPGGPCPHCDEVVAIGDLLIELRSTT